MSFRVNLQTFKGPLDLLLYLVRKHEIDPCNLPIAAITEQYLDYLEVLEALDVDSVGEFIELASTLVEIKSRLVLPRGGEETGELDDPREELVQRLLEYKKYKDAASMLDEQGRAWQQRYARQANDVGQREISPADQPIEELELWDLVSAFGRLMRDQQAAAAASIVYDETPIHVYMQRIHGRLIQQRRVAFSEMFAPGMHKSALIGVFLAILELVRHHSVRTEQNELHGEIWIVPGEDFSTEQDWSQADEYA